MVNVRMGDDSRQAARPASVGAVCVSELQLPPCSPAEAHTHLSNAAARFASMPGLHHIQVIQRCLLYKGYPGARH